MFRRLLFIALPSLLIFSCNTIWHSAQKKDEKDGIEIALREDYESIVDPALGVVPTERLLVAKEYKDELVRRKTRGAIPNINWTALGSQNQAGRSRCALVDLSDPSGNTVWVGSVGGGLWKTTNINTPSPNWSSNTQLLDNLAVSDIVQQANNVGTMYFCTGEGNGGSGAIRGVGVFKSTDTGKTWTRLLSTNTSSFHWTNRMLVLNNGILFVATAGGGLQRSTDGGATFTKVLGQGMGIAGANSNYANDIERDANGKLYCSLDGSLHESTDDGATWSPAISLPISAKRIEIACAPSNAQYLYLLVEHNNVVNGILQSTDGGLNFTVKNEPVDSDNDIPATDFSRGQAWYDLAIAVSPSDENTVWVGGIDLFKSTDGGNTWQQQTHWYGANYQYVHADQHDIEFSPFNSDICYFVHDGGIDQTLNAQNNIATFIYKGNNYNSIQFYSCAMHPDDGVSYYLAGSQDNGTQQFTNDFFAPTYEVTGGDGAFCHIDQNDPQFQITSYIYNNYRRSTDGGNNFTSVNINNNGRFINPTDYDNTNSLLYCANGNSEYGIWTNPKTGNNFVTRSIPQIGSSRVSCITVSPNVNNRVYFGSGLGKIVRVDNANAASPTIVDITGTGMPTNTTVSCIEVETGNDNHILAVFRNYGITSVWETQDGGTTWTSVEGNLPDVPVRWALFNPLNPAQALVATELGVWSTDSLQGPATVWGASNSGLANVRVDMLQTRASDKMVIAATHGRGLFVSDVFAAPKARFTAMTEVGYVGQPIKFINTSIKSNINHWDFGDGNNSTAVSPTHAYNTPGVYTVELDINNGASVETKANLITILPNRTAPFTLAQGGDFETNQTQFAADSIQGTKWELGNSTIAGKNGTTSGSNAWVTGLKEAKYSDNATSYLYTPMFTLPNTQTFNLSFDAKFALEAEYDGFIVEYSIDSGQTWQPLGQTVQPNWYNFQNNPQVSLVFPINQAFFTYTQNAFKNYNYNLSALSGKKVAFRFAFKSDDFVQEAGVAIDNFLISALGVPLNIHTINLYGSSTQGKHYLMWNTCCNAPHTEYAVLSSNDGINFTEIARYEVTEPIPSNLDKSFVVNSSAYYKIVANLGTEVIAESNIIRLGIAPTEITIAPNPIKDFISISGLSGIKYVDLYSSAGHKIQRYHCANGVIKLDNDITNGSYMLKIVSSNGELSRKIIVNR